MSDTQNDDLQNAINGIVNGTADATAAPATDAAAPDLGVPPVPPMAPEEAPADMQLPSMPVPDPAAGLMNATPEPIEEQAAEMPAPVTEVPEPVTAPVNELSDVKQLMISDLIPLMDKVQLTPEKKFAFYKEMIDIKHDKTMVPAAYEAAKGIADEAARAEALLYLINEAE
jgi:hypothetical protein